MSKGLADSGIEKWVADTTLLTMTYVDRAGARSSSNASNRTG